MKNKLMYTEPEINKDFEEIYMNVKERERTIAVQNNRGTQVLLKT